MNKRTLGIMLGIGAAGLFGYGAVTLVTKLLSRRHTASDDGTQAEVAAEQEQPERIIHDKRPEKITCPGCGGQVPEYDFFCPGCGYSMDRICGGPGSVEGRA